MFICVCRPFKAANSHKVLVPERNANADKVINDGHAAFKDGCSGQPFKIKKDLPDMFAHPNENKT